MNTVNRSELQAKYGDEEVFVIDTSDLPPMVEGIVLKSKPVIDVLRGYGFFAPRYQVEFNPTVKQPIPYIVIRCKDKIFGVRRLSGAGEARLHDKIALGVGGHINPEDETYTGDDMFINAIKRELQEELDISVDVEGVTNFQFLINDNSNDVSRDHLGIMVTIDIDYPIVTVKEKDKYEGKFYSISELRDNFDNLESWSQIVFDYLTRGVEV